MQLSTFFLQKSSTLSSSRHNERLDWCSQNQKDHEGCTVKSKDKLADNRAQIKAKAENAYAPKIAKKGRAPRAGSAKDTWLKRTDPDAYEEKRKARQEAMEALEAETAPEPVIASAPDSSLDDLKAEEARLTARTAWLNQQLHISEQAACEQPAIVAQPDEPKSPTPILSATEEALAKRDKRVSNLTTTIARLEAAIAHLEEPVKKPEEQHNEEQSNVVQLEVKKETPKDPIRDKEIRKKKYDLDLAKRRLEDTLNPKAKQLRDIEKLRTRIATTEERLLKTPPTTASEATKAERGMRELRQHLKELERELMNDPVGQPEPNAAAEPAKPAHPKPSRLERMTERYEEEQSRFEAAKLKFEHASREKLPTAKLLLINAKAQEARAKDAQDRLEKQRKTEATQAARKAEKLAAKLLQEQQPAPMKAPVLKLKHRRLERQHRRVSEELREAQIEIERQQQAQEEERQLQQGRPEEHASAGMSPHDGRISASQGGWASRTHRTSPDYPPVVWPDEDRGYNGRG
ncbi:MAG: hypothetical protein ACOYNL_03715 [Rickettsiales bacterium]